MDEKILIACWDDGTRVGRFIQNDPDDIRFVYEPDYAGIPLSVSLPLQSDTHDPKAATNYLDNLLPTSAAARRALALDQLKDDAAGDLDLLGDIGHECPGRLVFVRPDHEMYRSNRHRYVLADFLEEWRNHRESQPLLPDRRGVVTFTLSGSRPKAAIRLSGSNFYEGKYMLGDTTHILKAPSIGSGSDELDEEWVCMQVAAMVLANKQGAAKLPANKQVAHTERWKGFLKIDRFDRLTLQYGTVRRIHQEDFAQALGVPSNSSAADPPGAVPDSKSLLGQAASLIDQLGRQGRISVPVLQKRLFFRQLIIRLLFGDPGLGLKKFSIIHHDNGESKLAPLYGLRIGRLATHSMTHPEPRSVIVGTARCSDKFSEQAIVECAVLQLGLTKRYATRELRQSREYLLKIPGSIWSTELAREYPEIETSMQRVYAALQERLE